MKSISRQMFQFGFVLASVVIVVLLVGNFKNKNEIERLEINNRELLEKLEQSNNESIERKRGLDKTGLSVNKPANTIELHSWEKIKGLKDPVKDIISDLRQHRELIPYEGSLGGTMNFYSEGQIWILTKKWVLAYFEDGHNGGYLLLEYEVTKDGKIKWNTVTSYIA
ncbi:MAG: hypothetical protein H8D56_12095 [Planctomycetes bacterium]|nr:hypothetical protein [Planctomycetota bacterium]MBL7144264.1 hypothetical protein [Phycisphaerae bacterium]